ncbi:MAG TPA: hypothetical protein PKM41_04855 [Deltaproteobacteria bacterium]|nr:hypothetical protein [Deltaproteobacteria bacterium]
MMRKLAFITGIVLLLLANATGAFGQGAALTRVDSGGVSIYFPAGEEAIAGRLLEKTPGILSFLEGRGLPVTTPLHVVLDGEYDGPDVIVRMIPHREIRIPVKAPGVLEEGWLEADPWAYFLFRGMCLQGIYSLRQGLPEMARRVFGEVVTPNAIMPPWVFEGVCRILYSSWSGAPMIDPYSGAVFRTSVPKDLSLVSNHPGAWPGYHTGRICGIPFVSWVHDRYGWEGIRKFLLVHGGGIVPIEIDLKAREVFGKSWSALWEEFVQERPQASAGPSGMLIEGWWPDPFVYWNTSGVFPGRKGVELRGRYGCLDPQGVLWLSEYDDQGALRIVGHGNGITAEGRDRHVWDSSPGYVAVTRKGSRPHLAFLELEDRSPLARVRIVRTVPAPAGVTQLSGPVMSATGLVAVAGSTGGNWDIWVFGKGWERVTTHPGVEMDPSWHGDDLVFSSNSTGSFQIHDRTMAPLTSEPLAATLPRGRSYLGLTPSGWTPKALEVQPSRAPGQASPSGPAPKDGEPGKTPRLDAQPYSPLGSVWPNFIAPDLYVGPSDVQAGLVTWGRDVSGDYALRAGARYSFNLDHLSLQASAQIRDLGLSYARYPISYDPENALPTEESRSEAGISVRPFGLGWVTLGITRQDYEPLEDWGQEGDDLWVEASLTGRVGPLTPSLTLENHSGGLRSAFGGLSFVAGREITIVTRIQAGMSWGNATPGHGTFRVGGDVGEGYFTRRPSRLFPLRGFSPNVLESDRAVTASAEALFPLADLQLGHKTLPLFFHRLSLGTFVDAGFCTDAITRDQLLAGAGFEILTSMEVAWGNFSVFKIGIAWPVAQPDGLDEEGPVMVLQIGKPL